MAVLKPLTREEVPVEFLDRIDFDNQKQQRVPCKKRVKFRTVVSVKCEICKESNLVAVNDIRNWIKGIRRSQFPGTHRKCRYLGKRITNEGYIHIYKPSHPYAYQGQYVPEHILVMEQILGRYIDRKNESVHHINGDKADNRPENLQLRKRYHGKGQKWTCSDCGSHNIVASKLG